MESCIHIITPLNLFFLVLFRMREWKCLFCIHNYVDQYLLKENCYCWEGGCFLCFYVHHFSFYNWTPSTSSWIKGPWVYFNVWLVKKVSSVYLFTLYKTTVWLLTVTFFSLCVSVMTLDLWCVCFENKGFKVCRDMLFPWTQFKSLGNDLHAARLPEDSRGSFTRIWGLCLISWSFHSITGWGEKGEAIWRRLF